MLKNHIIFWKTIEWSVFIIILRITFIFFNFLIKINNFFFLEIDCTLLVSFHT